MKRVPRVIGLMTILLLLGNGIASAAPVQADAPPADAKIELVWPHNPDGSYNPAGQLVNVEVYLFQRGTLDPFPCDFANQVRLRWAMNDWGRTWGPGSPPGGSFGALLPAGDAVPGYGLPDGAVGQRLIRTVDGKTFPYWLFNDVPVATYLASAKPVVRSTYFLVEVDGVEARTNVWAHAGDPRTVLPNPLLPEAVVGADLDLFDAMIQMVYPHDAQGRLQPVDKAPLVNIAVDLFRHPVGFEFPAEAPPPAAVGYGRNRSLWLLRSLNDGYLERVKRANEVISEKRAEPRLDWSRWVFNDVDVAAASDPANKYYFAVQVEGVTTHTTVWAHGADSRTYFPQRDVPTRSGPHCP